MKCYRSSRNVIPARYCICVVALLIVQTIVLTFDRRNVFAADEESGTNQSVRNIGRYAVNDQGSWLRVLVYRDGLLGGFGHNHVISQQRITGAVVLASDLSQSTLTLNFSLADLAVDDPDIRALLGPDFANDVSNKDRAGTRANLLGDKLLQEAQFPDMQIRSNHISGALPRLEIAATVVVSGGEYALLFPALVKIENGSLVASGELEIGHADIGLTPFKAFLSTIKVRDTMLLQYYITADLVTL